MGKNSNKSNKKRRLADSNATAGPSSYKSPSKPAPTDYEGDSSISDEDLLITIETLNALAEDPSELADRRVKDLKRSLYGLHRVLGEGAALGTSLTSKISTALRDYRFEDALILLYEMFVRKIPPKLGALQRWVRECDATSTVDTEADPDAMRCLDLILRIAGGTVDPERVGAVMEGGLQIVHKPVWSARGDIEGEIKVWERMTNGNVFDQPPPSPYPQFRVVQHTEPHLRRPPNLYPSTVYASSPEAIKLTPTSERPRSPSSIPVPGVPGAFIVLDVFTPEECLQIVQAAEAMGFEKDEPAQGSATMKNSILARNFVWLSDKSFLDHFYSQLLPFVPPTAHRTEDGQGGGKVRGINARFRVYQYTQNQAYRPHIDGAWPAAGLSETGEYLHDSQPSNDPLWSRYTLLVYLNSDIPEGTGSTTFFLPSDKIGVMEATSVRPIQGAVLCFPHGDTHGSLLHEGSSVGEGGGKFVIRTDLLYEAKGFGQFKPPTEQLAGL